MCCLCLFFFYLQVGQKPRHTYPRRDPKMIQRVISSGKVFVKYIFEVVAMILTITGKYKGC